MRATLPAPSENCEGNSMIERAVKREIDTCASLSSDANRLVTLCVCVCVCVCVEGLPMTSALLVILFEKARTSLGDSVCMQLL